MSDTSHGLHTQAVAILDANGRVDATLQVLINKANDDDTVVVDLETLRSLRIHVNSAAIVVQKQAHKIEKLETELFNT